MRLRWLAHDVENSDVSSNLTSANGIASDLNFNQSISDSITQKIIIIF